MSFTLLSSISYPDPDIKVIHFHYRDSGPHIVAALYWIRLINTFIRNIGSPAGSSRASLFRLRSAVSLDSEVEAEAVGKKTLIKGWAPRKSAQIRGQIQKLWVDCNFGIRDQLTAFRSLLSFAKCGVRFRLGMQPIDMAGQNKAQVRKPVQVAQN